MLTGDARLRRLRFRAWHRGTKESDMVLGGFVDSRLDGLSDTDMDWLERLFEEQDVDILAWVINGAPCPSHLDGPLMDDLRRLDYIDPDRLT